MIYQIESIELLYKAVEKLARKFLPADSDDLTQEVIIKLWTARSRLPRRFGISYLNAIVRHAAYDEMRKKQRQNRMLGYSFNENGSVSSYAQPEKQLFVAESTYSYREQKDLLADAEEAVLSLSPDHRMAIELRADGLEYTEIAEKTGFRSVR